MDHPKNTLYYVSIPPEIADSIEGLTLDPDIPLPVETTVPGQTLPVEEITWENLIAGLLRSLREEPGQARADYYRRIILAAKPRIFQELTTAAVYKAQDRDFGLASEILDSLEALDPQNPRTLLNQALLLEDRLAGGEAAGNPDLRSLLENKAGEYYEKVLSREPVLPDALLNAGFFYRGRRDFLKAAELLGRYLRENEGGDAAKLAEARTALSELEREQESLDLYSQARTAVEEDRIEEGISAISNYLESNPSSARGWFLLGWAQRKNGEYPKAEESLSQAQEQNSDPGLSQDLLNELAICALEREDYGTALAHLERALPLNPGNTKIISNIGSVKMKRGEWKEARRYFETVLALDPQDPLAPSILEQLPADEP